MWQRSRSELWLRNTHQFVSQLKPSGVRRGVHHELRPHSPSLNGAQLAWQYIPATKLPLLHCPELRAGEQV